MFLLLFYVYDSYRVHMSMFLLLFDVYDSYRVHMSMFLLLFEIFIPHAHKNSMYLHLLDMILAATFILALTTRIIRRDCDDSSYTHIHTHVQLRPSHVEVRCAMRISPRRKDADPSAGCNAS